MSDDQVRFPQKTARRSTRGALLPLDRFNAFSDGVFAIAITLLVLEIAIPHAGVPVLPALREQWPEFLGYYISFAFIGGIWIAHSGVTKFMKQRGPGVVLAEPAAAALRRPAALQHGAHGHAPGRGRPQARGPVLRRRTCCSPRSCSACSSATSRGNRRCSSTRSLKAHCGASPGSAGPSLGLNVLAIAVTLVAPKVAVGLYLVETTLLLIIPFLGLRRHRRRPNAG